jgi:hypothetical protein
VNHGRVSACWAAGLGSSSAQFEQCGTSYTEQVRRSAVYEQPFGSYMDSQTAKTEIYIGLACDTASQILVVFYFYFYF